MTVVSGQWSVVSGQWSVVSGQWSVVSGQWSVVSGQWSVVSGQWSDKLLAACTECQANCLVAASAGAARKKLITDN
jgi:hypothetical protein